MPIPCDRPLPTPQHMSVFCKVFNHYRVIYLDKIGNKNNLYYVFKFVKLCIFSRLLAKVRNILVTCLSWNISINISWIYLMFEVAHRWWAKYFPTFNYFFKYMYIIFCVADSNVQRFGHGHVECLIYPSSIKILAMLYLTHNRKLLICDWGIRVISSWIHLSKYRV